MAECGEPDTGRCQRLEPDEKQQQQRQHQSVKPIRHRHGADTVLPSPDIRHLQAACQPIPQHQDRRIVMRTVILSRSCGRLFLAAVVYAIPLATASGATLRRSPLSSSCLPTISISIILSNCGKSLTTSTHLRSKGTSQITVGSVELRRIQRS